MNRPYYSEYIRHCLRFYCRNTTKPDFKNEVDKCNWLSCHSIISKCNETDRQYLIEVYCSFDTLADSVYETAKKYSINQNIIWDLIKDIERRIAKRRGLL